MLQFTKNVFQAAITDAIAAGGVAKTEDALRTGNQLTPQYLDDFFGGLEREKPSAEVQAKLQVLVTSMLNMSVDDFSKVVRDFAAKDRHEKLAAQAATPEEKARMLGAKYDSDRTRAKEMRQIYGAVRFAGLDVSGIGWNQAYNRGVRALSEKNIKWDGTAVPTDEQNEKNRDKKQARRIAQEVKDAVQDLVNAGVEVKPEHYSEIATRVTTSLAGRDAKRKAIQLVRAVGPEFADLIALSLPEVIAVAKANGDTGLDEMEESLKDPVTKDLVKAAQDEIAAKAKGQTEQQRKAA